MTANVSCGRVRHLKVNHNQELTFKAENLIKKLFNTHERNKKLNVTLQTINIPSQPADERDIFSI